MNFGYNDLGSQSGGEIVEIELLGTEANVFLVDSSNFSSYKNGHDYKYYGGHFKTSPVRLQIPHSGHWFAVVDLGGFIGNVKFSTKILSSR